MLRVFAVGLIVALSAGLAEAKISVSEEAKVKEGDSVFAVVVDCPQADPTFGGAEEGTIGPDRCGQCLIQANWGTTLRYPYDLHIKGMLLDENGKPISNRLIHFFLPNGWVVKTRSAETGYFRILLGATAERKSDKPLTLDIGTKKMRKDNKAEYYAIFLMQDGFKPCAEKEPEKKPEKK